MLAIIADDLTGALDTAAPFASRGLHCEVALTVEAIARAVSEDPAVLSVDISSREMTPGAAQAAMAAALALLPPGTTIFKKIDSRLKGHVADELDVIPYRFALVAPAIPAVIDEDIPAISSAAAKIIPACSPNSGTSTA